LQEALYLPTAPGLTAAPGASEAPHGLQLPRAAALRPPPGRVSTGRLPLAVPSYSFHSGAGVGDGTWQQGGQQQQQHQGQHVQVRTLLPLALHQQFGSMTGPLRLGPSANPAAAGASAAGAPGADVFDDPVAAAVAASAAHSAAQQTQGVFSMDLPAVGAAELASPCAPWPLSPNSTVDFFTSDAEALTATGLSAVAAAETAAAAVGSGAAAGAGSFVAPAGSARGHGSVVLEDTRAAAAVEAEAAAGGGVQQQFARSAAALRLPAGCAGGGTAAAVGSGSAAVIPTLNVSAGGASAAWVCGTDLHDRNIVSHSQQSISAHSYSESHSDSL